MPRSKHVIDLIPKAGWWREESRAVYLRLHDALVDMGLDNDDAGQFLAYAYYAAAAEYGD